MQGTRARIYGSEVAYVLYVIRHGKTASLFRSKIVNCFFRSSLIIKKIFQVSRVRRDIKLEKIRNPVIRSNFRI